MIHKADLLMPRLIKILKFLLIFLLIALFNSCAPAKKNPFYEKRMNASRVNASQLGRNRYYFSKDYQKKLVKSYKRKKDF
jgi:hypothetical protein